MVHKEPDPLEELSLLSSLKKCPNQDLRIPREELRDTRSISRMNETSYEQSRFFPKPSDVKLLSRKFAWVGGYAKIYSCITRN